MKKLKDMSLRLGDRITFGDGIVIIYDDYFSKDDEIYAGNVLKIERPTRYETIYEAPKQILDKKEKEYLEAVIRPFRDRVKSVSKLLSFGAKEEEHIYIELSNIDGVGLPNFKSGTMYKGMEIGKEYALDELGLFKE